MTNMSKMTKLNRWLLQGYRSKSPDGWGRSPLDIPDRAIVYSFVVALLFSLLIGNVYVEWLWQQSRNELLALKRDEIGLQSNAMIFEAVIKKFLPQQSIPRTKDLDFTKDIEENFKDPIAFNAVYKFLKKSSASDSTKPNKKNNTTKLDSVKLISDILGDLTRKWHILPPRFSQKTESDILEFAGIYESYAPASSAAPEKWRRDILISAIAQLRGKLSGEWYKSRRQIQMLADYIQWLTFIFAVWCLLLLIGFRMPWAKLQTRLVTTGRLPWYDSDEPSLWEFKRLQVGKRHLYASLNDHYPGMFMPARLLQEVILVKEHDRSISSREIVRERVAAYRNSVDEGEYEIINFLIWAVPTLGFLGTIIGIIGAMENAANIVRAIGPIEQAAAIKQVGVYLGTAFDTTFVALLWVLPLSFLLARTRKIEANLFERVEFEANSYLLEQLDDAAIIGGKERKL